MAKGSSLADAIAAADVMASRCGGKQADPLSKLSLTMARKLAGPAALGELTPELWDRWLKCRPRLLAEWMTVSAAAPIPWTNEALAAALEADYESSQALIVATNRCNNPGRRLELARLVLTAAPGYGGISSTLLLPTSGP